MLYQLSYTRPTDFELRISNADLKRTTATRIVIPKSAFRNPKFFLVQGVGFEPT